MDCHVTSLLVDKVFLNEVALNVIRGESAVQGFLKSRKSNLSKRFQDQKD
jgi:hypothetical protein